MYHQLIELVEVAAKKRGEVKVPRDYITEAIEQIVHGEAEVRFYPRTNFPSLKDVYDLALTIYGEETE